MLDQNDNSKMGQHKAFLFSKMGSSQSMLSILSLDLEISYRIIENIRWQFALCNGPLRVEGFDRMS